MMAFAHAVFWTSGMSLCQDAVHDLPGTLNPPQVRLAFPQQNIKGLSPQKRIVWVSEARIALPT